LKRRVKPVSKDWFGAGKEKYRKRKMPGRIGVNLYRRISELKLTVKIFIKYNQPPTLASTKCI
jgi:hypothetical protein